MPTAPFTLDAPRATRYSELMSHVQSLVGKETDWVAATANIAALLYQGMGFFWVGFYRVRRAAKENIVQDIEEGELVLGPFQGPVACGRIGYNQGVCGRAWAERRSFLVPDVHAFEGHIACNAASSAELVVPIFHNGEVVLILDIDSDRPNDFSSHDQNAIERLAAYCATTAWIANTGAEDTIGASTSPK